MARQKQVTVTDFLNMKSEGRKITMLTAYDYRMAGLLDAAGVDGILVGDSMAMVVQGRQTTLPVTLDEMIYHAEMVCRAVRRAMVIVDLPFPINHAALDRTIENAGRILKETGCQAVKLEGSAKQADVIAALCTAGIPVVAHVGLRPQSIHLTGRYKIQRNEEAMMRDALSAQNAGAFAIVLECVVREIAAKITAELQIPTIGIGSGAACDGQVLVTDDMLGLTSGYVPSFVKQYADLQGVISGAVRRYCDDVRAGEFPASDQSFQ